MLEASIITHLTLIDMKAVISTDTSDLLIYPILLQYIYFDRSAAALDDYFHHFVSVSISALVIVPLFSAVPFLKIGFVLRKKH
jgi:hypothetical protein